MTVSKLADTIRTDWVVDQLAQDHAEPFFLALGSTRIPNYCPQKYFDLYRESDIKLPLTLMATWTTSLRKFEDQDSQITHPPKA